MLNGLEPFLQRLFFQLDLAGVDVSRYEMDHVCYRVATMERYEELRHAWFRYTKDFAFHESLVNGRPISVFVLAHPPAIDGRTISVIELPAPKEGSFHAEGWEHAEFVIREPFESFIARHPRLVFDRNGLGKPFNPELGLKLGVGIQAKFHHRPLSQVIEIERRTGITLTSED